MQIYILRHGQAEPQQTTDEARNLTVSGRSAVATTITSSLADLKAVEEIWVSPLIRAQQTMRIAADILLHEGIPVAIKTTDLIVPEASPYALLDALQKTNINSILLVSHQPLVSNLIDLLCGKGNDQHSMNTSSLACVDSEIVDAEMGKLRWLRHVNG